MAKITRIGVLKMACFMGLYGAIIGLIAALIIGILFTIIMGSLSESLGSTVSALVIGFSWINLILFPIISGVAGFIGGLILTPIMNLVLKIVKGIDLDIEVEDTYTPQQQSVYPRGPSY